MIIYWNRTSLGHDYYTDILTFNYVAEELINGDLFISVDRVSDNAVTNGVSFDQELSRVVIHGVLHLLGYEDSTEDDIVEMRAEEDYCLNILNND
jgi:rRNA maturation RNase YbeY